MWKEDLKDGEYAERVFADYLIRVGKHNVVHKALGDFKDYDLLGDLNTTYEVKSDRIARTTGNIAIEFQYHGEPSGIVITKANYWVQRIAEKEFYVFLVRALRDWLNIQRQYLNTATSVEGACVYLVRLDDVVGRPFCNVVLLG